MSRTLRQSIGSFDSMPDVLGDAIVESGSNADGGWTKWADGTQINAQEGSRVLSQTLAAGSMYATSVELSWTYPSPLLTFSAASLQSGRADSTVGFYGYMTHRTATTTGLTYRHVTPGTAGTVSLLENLIAVGRWK